MIILIAFNLSKAQSQNPWEIFPMGNRCKTSSHKLPSYSKQGKILGINGS